MVKIFFKMREQIKQWAGPLVLLVFLCAGIFAADVLRAKDTEGLIAGTDEENHLPRIMHLYRAARYRPNASPFNESVDYWPNWWPPLTYRCGAQAFKILGPSRQSAIAAIAFFHIIIGLAAFTAVVRFAGPWSALCAAALSMLPASVMHFAGIVGLDLALAAMVCAATSCLLLSEGFAKILPSILFGVFCGLGMLAKITFPIFIIPALIVSLILYRKDLNLRSWTLVLIAVFIAAAIASVWYFDRAVLIARSLYFHLIDYQTKPQASFLRTESGGFFLKDLAAAAGLGVLALTVFGVGDAIRRRSSPEIILASSICVSLIIVAAAPSNPERFWLPAVPLGVMLGCFALARIKLTSKRIIVAALFFALIGAASASRIYGAVPSVPFIFPEKQSRPVLVNQDEFASAVIDTDLPIGGEFCVFSDSDRIFHEGYLRYLVQRKRPDLHGWVWGPVHFHHRQLEDFFNRLAGCQTAVFRTSRSDITKPDRQSILRAVYLGEAHSMKQFDGELAKGFFPKNYDIEKRVSESFAPFEYAGEMSLQKESDDDVAIRIVLLTKKKTDSS